MKIQKIFFEHVKSLLDKPESQEFFSPITGKIPVREVSNQA